MPKPRGLERVNCRRNIWIPEHLWAYVRSRADADGRSAGEIVRIALRAYRDSVVNLIKPKP